MICAVHIHKCVLYHYTIQAFRHCTDHGFDPSCGSRLVICAPETCPEIGSKNRAFDNVRHSAAWYKLFPACSLEAARKCLVLLVITASQWCHLLFHPRFYLYRLQEMDDRWTGQEFAT